MERYGFCVRVCGYLKGASRRELEGVEAELRAHIDDHAAALMEAGWSEEDAYRKAEEAMGDADEVGRELSLEYPKLWLNISRIAAGVLIVLVVFLALPILYSTVNAARSVLVRIAPQCAAPAFDHDGGESAPEIKPMSLRLYLDGGDVAYFYGQSTVPSADPDIDSDYAAVLYFCVYDRNPFQEARIAPPVWYDSGMEGPSGGNNGSIFYQDMSYSYWYGYYYLYIPAEKGQKTVKVCYKNGGRYYTVTVPLDWSGVE